MRIIWSEIAQATFVRFMADQAGMMAVNRAVEALADDPAPPGAFVRGAYRRLRVRRHPAYDRAQQVPPGQRPLAALGQDGAALAHLQCGLLPGPSGQEVVIPGPVGRRQQVPACGPLSGRTVRVAGSGWGGGRRLLAAVAAQESGDFGAGWLGVIG
jgi:hypothetical protein